MGPRLLSVLSLLVILFSCSGSDSGSGLPVDDVQLGADVQFDHDLSSNADEVSETDTVPDFGGTDVPGADEQDGPDGVVSDVVVDLWGDGAGTDLTDAVPEVVDSTSIADLQDHAQSVQCSVPFGSLKVGAGIHLSNVVVTAPVYSFTVGAEPMDGFYVADDVGPSAGLHVAYPAGTLPNLKVGMVMDLVGDHKEVSCFTTLYATQLVVTDPNGPAPQPYDTTTAELASSPEGFEGVLVRVQNVEVTSANPDALDAHQMVVDGVLRVGNDYSVPYLSYGTDARAVGDQFNHIIGVLRYVDAKWVLMPRTAADMWRTGDEPIDDQQPEVVEIVEMVEVISDVVEDVSSPEVVEIVPELPDVVEIVDDVPVEDVPTTPDIVIPSSPDSPVVINEIMYDPDSPVYDDKGEWIELYNASDETVDLNGWRVSADDLNQFVILNGAPLLLGPGEYLLLGNSSVESQNGGIEIDYPYPTVDFSLDNVTDSVVLRNIYGVVVDSVHYSEATGWTEAKGASLQLLHPNLDNENLLYWAPATTPYGDGSNLGTPGSKNF